MKEVIENRYITLDGTKITKSGNPQHRLKAEFKNAGNLSILSLSALEYLSSPEFWDLNGAIGGAIIKSTSDLAQLLKLKNEFGIAALNGTLLIDTRPDENTQRLTGYGPAISNMKNFYNLHTKRYALQTALGSAILSYMDPSNAASSSIFISTVFSGSLTNYINGINRFSKIQANEWALIDKKNLVQKSSRQEQEQMQTAPLTAPAGA